MSCTANQTISINRHALGARSRSLWIAWVACLIAAPSYASQITQIRVGNHPTYTRLVFELDAPTGYRIERHAAADGGGERLVVTLDASSRSRAIESKSVGIESVYVEQHESKAVAQIKLRKSGLPMKEMILSNPPRIVLDFELPASVAIAPKQPAVKPRTTTRTPDKVVAKALPKPKPAPEPKPIAVAPKPAVLAKVDSVPTPDDKSEPAREAQRRAERRAKIPGVHKRDDLAAKPAPKPESDTPSDPIANAAPEAKPAVDPAQRAKARASVEKLSQERKKKTLRAAAKSAPAPKPKESPVDMAVVAAVAAVVLIVGVLVVRRSRRRSISSALDVAALAEEAELDAEPAAADTSAAVNESIPVKGFSMDGAARAIEPSLRENEENAAAYSMSEVAANETESGLYNEDTEGEKKMDLDASEMSVDVESAEFNTSPPIVTGGGSDSSQLVQDLASRLATLETRLDEVSEARERLERQVAAQSEELRVQRAAIARTQRALRSLSRSEAEQATEPALRDPAKQADSSA